MLGMAERCDVLAGAARLQRDLIDVRAEKQRLADKLEVLEADARQYQEELRLSQVGRRASLENSPTPSFSNLLACMERLWRVLKAIACPAGPPVFEIPVFEIPRRYLGGHLTLHHECWFLGA